MAYEVSDAAATAAIRGTFVPTYQGLSAVDFVRPAPATRAACFPFNVDGRLPFYRARNAIYHLFTALVEQNPRLTVLAPDYNSGNEILAMRAAGARIEYAGRPPEQLDRRRLNGCARCTPGSALCHSLRRLARRCRRSSTSVANAHVMVEDCALSLLSETAEGPLGSFGDWSVFCLYKTLPLPNGALLVQNTQRIEALERLPLRHAGSASVLGRTAELLVQRIRGRANRVGAALQVVKRGMGRAAGALDVRRANVGDIGFNLDEVDLAMSGVSAGCSIGSTSPTSAAGASPLPRLERNSTSPYRGCSRTARRRVPALFRSSCATSRRGPHAAGARRRCPRIWNESTESGTRWDRMRASCGRTSSSCRSPGPRATAPRARGARGLRAVTQAGRVMTPRLGVRSPHAMPAHSIRVETIDTAWD